MVRSTLEKDSPVLVESVDCCWVAGAAAAVVVAAAAEETGAGV